MKKLSTLILLATLIYITGCGSTMHVAKKYQGNDGDVFSYSFEYKNDTLVPEKALNILKERLDLELGKKNLLSATVDDSSNKIEIIFNNYYMRHDGARIGVGILAGTDVIDTLVLIKSNDGNNILGEFTVKSTNNTAWGTSKGLIEGHADKIVTYLSENVN